MYTQSLSQRCTEDFLTAFANTSASSAVKSYSMKSAAHHIKSAQARLIRVPVDPPRGDAIQQFNALELPIVTITDSANRTGIGFGYTIGTAAAQSSNCSALNCSICSSARTPDALP